MTPNELVDKFKMDRYSLSSIELDELFELISKNNDLVRDIKDNWLMDDYISRIIASDRQKFPAQVLKRIADMEPQQNNVLTMEQIINASKTVKLSTSGRYRNKISDRKPSIVSSKNVAATSSRKTKAVSGRRKFSRKSRTNTVFLILAAMLILSVGMFLYNTNSSTNSLNSNFESDAPTILSAKNAIIIDGVNPKNETLLGLRLKEGSEIKVDKGGSVTLEYSDRTKIVVQEDSILKIRSTKNKDLFLVSGHINCEVSKQKIPLKITTFNSIALVIGTSFTLGVKKDLTGPQKSATELVVTHGIVEIEKSTTKEKIFVSQGQQTFVSSDKNLMVVESLKKNLKYDFSNTQLPNGLELIEIKNAEYINGALNIAGGMANFKLKTAGWKFPLKISFETKFSPSTKEKSIVLISGVRWKDNSYGIQARGIPFDMVSDIWVKFDTYITEDNYFYGVCNSIDKNNRGNICTEFSYMEKGSNSDALILSLFGYEDGNVEFDNIEVHEINNADLPDMTEAKEIFKNLPRAKDTQNIFYEKFPIIINDQKQYWKVLIQFGPKAIEK